jgi:hypothetical protein
MFYIDSGRPVWQGERVKTNVNSRMSPVARKGTSEFTFSFHKREAPLSESGGSQDRHAGEDGELRISLTPGSIFGQVAQSGRALGLTTSDVAGSNPALSSSFPQSHVGLTIHGGMGPVKKRQSVKCCCSGEGCLSSGGEPTLARVMLQAVTWTGNLIFRRAVAERPAPFPRMVTDTPAASLDGVRTDPSGQNF